MNLYPHIRSEFSGAQFSVCRCGNSVVCWPDTTSVPPQTWGSACPAALRERIAALESAPTFADGVRAGLEAALEVVHTATGAADNRLRANGGRVGADVCDELRVVAGDIEEIGPSTVKPSVG